MPSKWIKNNKTGLIWEIANEDHADRLLATRELDGSATYSLTDPPAAAGAKTPGAEAGTPGATGGQATNDLPEDLKHVGGGYYAFTDKDGNVRKIQGRAEALAAFEADRKAE